MALSIDRGETSPPLIERTTGANFERMARERADREALVEVASGRRWTYAELDRDVDASASALIGAGIENGDRVGIWAPNRAEWTLLQLAPPGSSASRASATPAPDRGES